MAEISDLEPVDADNIARFPEGQKVPTLNNGARALEGIVARYFADTNGSIVSTGTQPNYAVATSRAIPSLVDGVVVVWRAHAAFASGTATLTVNALTVRNLVHQGGSALSVGDLLIDQTVVSRYNSELDAFECLGMGKATQAQMETATAVDVAVTPGVQHSHPGHPKFWAKVTVSGGTPTLAASYSVTSITDTGTGLLTVNIGTDFSGVDWCCGAVIERASTGTSDNDTRFWNIRTGGQAAGSILIECFRGSFLDNNLALADPAAWHVWGFGDQ